jgi:hypothetical protein
MTAPDTLPPELAELGELVREDRPQPDERWARQLDARVAAGFPRRRRERFGWPRIRPLMPAFGLAATVLLVVTVAVSLPQGSDDDEGGGGASSSAPTTAQEESGSAGSGSDEGGGADLLQEQARSSGAAQPSVGGDDEAPVAPPATQRDPNSDSREPRQVERSASLALAAPPDEVERVADGIGRVTDEVGGFVAAASVSSNGGDFSLRIPTARLDDALARLSRLAHVRERERRSQDITAQSVSARTRLREAEAERRSLLRQLARADTPNETASVRARLRTVSREIEAARARVRRVDNRASFADVTVSLVSDEDVGGAAADGQWTPGDAAADAVRVLEVAVGVALVALAAALPLLLMLLLAWLASRQVVRRRRERALDMA